MLGLYFGPFSIEDNAVLLIQFPKNLSFQDIPVNRISQSLELSSRIQSSVIGGGGANNQQTTNQSQHEQSRSGIEKILCVSVI